MSSNKNIRIAFLVIISLASIFASTARASDESSKKQRYECLFCTFGIGLLEQLGQVHNETVTASLQRVCELLSDTKFQSACEMVVKFIGPRLINLLYRHITPDVACAKLSMCPTLPDGRSPQCHLFPKQRSNGNLYFARVDRDWTAKEDISSSLALPPFCKWPGARFFCDLFDRLHNLHTPLIDFDGDGFSLAETFRGSAWRGKDCNDALSAVHPGARPLKNDVESDSNCNGILGVDHKTGHPYETLYCEDSRPLGLMIIGDSAGARFHIPEQWLEARLLSRDILTHLPYVISNEFDWPMASFTTGYRNVTWPIIDGYTVSVYEYLRNRNLCNHRDYHNLGVNGAGTKDPPSYIRNMTIRSNVTDHPLLLFYEFVGNDVCNKHNDTLAHMTTPEQIKKNVLHSLKILDTLLPNGSHVFMTGLANGSFLWEGLSTRYHPIGRLNQDIRYPEFYDFLSCIGVNPCGGWMTTNDTLRRLTTERAEKLSEVIEGVAKEYRHHFKNFDLEYITCPLTTIVEDWEKSHGKDKIWQLIEATDGFHPNQLANNLIAEHVWRFMEKKIPHFIGPVNPHNAKIAAIFGDQGGY